MVLQALIEGSLEVKLPTLWTDGKAEVGRARERERERRKKIQVREKVGKSRNTVFFQCFVAKSRLAKVAGAEPCGQMRDEKLHAVVVRSIFPSQNVQNKPCSDNFWKLRRAVVARSAFGSQKCKKLTGSDHFWKLKCRKVHAVVV